MTITEDIASLTEYPTFIDLKVFAAAAPRLAGSDPFGNDRVLLPLRDAPVEVGVIHLATGSGNAATMEGDAFLVAVSGEVEVASAGGTTVLTRSEACVVTSGAAIAWTARSDTTLLFMRYIDGRDSTPGIVSIDCAATLVPSGAPLAELLVGETPSCRNHTDFRSADGVFTCGVWDSTPYHRMTMPYRHFELMVLLQGRVTFVDEVGRAGTFAAGDIFLIEQGAQCSWESREDVAKIYAIYRPLA